MQRYVNDGCPYSKRRFSGQRTTEKRQTSGAVDQRLIGLNPVGTGHFRAFGSNPASATRHDNNCPLPLVQCRVPDIQKLDDQRGFSWGLESEIHCNKNPQNNCLFVVFLKNWLASFWYDSESD